MYGSTRIAAVAVLSGMLAACGDASGPDDVELSIVKQGLLLDAEKVELRFYRRGRSCADLSATLPRVEAVLGPFTLPLDATQRREGTVFQSQEIPAGKYVLLGDAIDDGGRVVGTGCTDLAEVRDGEASVIRVVIDG